MKAGIVVSLVVAVHVVAVGWIMLSQGCGTTPKPAPAKEAVAAPPSVVKEAEAPPPVLPALPKPSVIEKPPVATPTYVVQPGDSLSKIAARCGLRTADLAGLNGLTNPNALRVGQQLRLPPGTVAEGGAKAAGLPAAKAEAKPAAHAAKPASRTVPVAGQAGAAAAGGGSYVVKAGDSLSKIAAAHHTSLAAIRQANNLTVDKLRIGQKLVLPAAGAALAAKSEAKAATPPERQAETKPATVAPPAVPLLAAPVAAVEPAPLVPAPTANAVRTHTVQQDEDLAAIAMLYNVSVARLKEFNGLGDGAVQPGQTLKIPLAE